MTFDARSHKHKVQREPNKFVDEALDAHVSEHFLAGNWPEVNWHGRKNENGKIVTQSFHLFEYAAVHSLYRRCLHETLKERGIEYGIHDASRRHEYLEWVRGIIARINPVFGKELVKGQLVRLWGMEGRKWENDRVGKVDATLYQGHIFDFACTEINGYYAETGSAYVWEVKVVQGGEENDRVWQPFHLTKEDVEFKKEVDGVLGD